jgi:hypothetical protein
MKPRILFRASLAEENELQIAKKYFNVIESRAQIKTGDTILCRYSFLPYGDELEADVKLLGGQLINSYSQHRYVADLYNYYQDLKDYTPFTWFSLEEALNDEFNGPYVLKGATNSKKSQWSTMMFAPTRNDMRRIYFDLMDDGLIGNQSICIRRFEPLITYTTALNGQPIAKEFRVFILNGNVMAKGYYWTNYPEVIEQFNPNPNEIPADWLAAVINKVKDNIPAFVIDVAQKQDGSWIVIECNDLCMSGLSGVDADELYRNLSNSF